MKNILIIICAAISLLSCGKLKHNRACKDGNQDFLNVYSNIVSSSKVTMDTEIHEYTFTLSSAQEICEIGYQSQKKLKDTQYVIEIYDHLNDVVIYSEGHIFKHKKTSYIIPNQSILLNANQTYTIRRIQTDWDGNIGNTIGVLKSPDNLVFPLSIGIITITGSNFYDVGATPNNGNFGVPFIDIVFK